MVSDRKAKNSSPFFGQIQIGGRNNSSPSILMVSDRKAEKSVPPFSMDSDRRAKNNQPHLFDGFRKDGEKSHTNLFRWF